MSYVSHLKSKSMKEVEVKEVVITTLARAGRGIEGNPIRSVLQVWDKNGDLIAERDDFLLEKLKEPEPVQSRVAVYDLGEDPEILAAFPISFGCIHCPAKDWYVEVQKLIKINFNTEPGGRRHDIMYNTLVWLDKKIKSMK